MIVMLVVWILLAAGATVVLAVREPQCDHTVYPNIHPGSARIFYACRCGKRFDR